MGFFISAFGFFLTHSLATGWVNQHATHAKASASALYLVFYYLGASTGGPVSASVLAVARLVGRRAGIVIRLCRSSVVVRHVKDFVLPQEHASSAVNSSPPVPPAAD